MPHNPSRRHCCPVGAPRSASTPSYLSRASLSLFSSTLLAFLGGHSVCLSATKGKSLFDAKTKTGNSAVRKMSAGTSNFWNFRHEYGLTSTFGGLRVSAGPSHDV